jgi:hypothetical protein
MTRECLMPVIDSRGEWNVCTQVARYAIRKAGESDVTCYRCGFHVQRILSATVEGQYVADKLEERQP